MVRRLSIAAVAAVALGAVALPVEAQDADVLEDVAAPDTTSSGEVVAVIDEDGHSHYFLQLADGTQVELRFGPSWFWGPLNPLDSLIGTTVDVTGNVAADGPDEHASATGQAHAANKPKLHVKAVNGASLRTHGKPPWAGGPKVVGESHPGHAGWSKGHAANAHGPHDD